MLELSNIIFPKLEYNKSFLVGDKISDCLAGSNYGLEYAKLFILNDGILGISSLCMSSMFILYITTERLKKP